MQNHKLFSLTLFVAPALFFYGLFLVAPMIGGIVYSFTNWDGLNPAFRFIGLRNYTEALWTDHNFIHSILFTFKYAAVVLVLQNGLALALALMIESKIKTKSLFRTVFFLPNMLSMIIGSFMWTFIFLKVLPEVAKLAAMPALDQSWLGDPGLAFYSILIVSLWTGTGYMMLIYMAALQGVPQELKEAAIIDGAGKVRVFFHVTLPMIMNAITICLFLTLNSAFKIFDTVYALTGGGPGRATQVMCLNIYDEAFSNNFRFGYADAKAIILFFIVLLITLIQLRIMKKREVEA
ncbi:Hypothetical protein LUCI_0929 [Lucifera butyrica]|uniref:ABC transmembrane type-1 domain-containing protein n=1 Tax=Lucifera butyrica TaxID=1351585 RepID=A0A498R9B1_9FIRM|nr:sugar ABC transporter permease [Lucifera butyrica]VBB05718.1 Hypothetical protein LUCI_0929 [Lucifera butyrica]